MRLLRTSHTQISKQLTLLFWIFIIGFSLQAVIHFSQNHFSQQLDKQIQNAQTQAILGNELIFRIKNIQQQYFQLTSQIKPKTRTLILKHVDEDIAEIHKLIDVLENGGSFSQGLKLNLPDKDSFINVLSYTATNDSQFNVVRISILPKINKIREWFDITNAELDKEHRNLNSDLEEVVTIYQSIQQIIKNVDPYFVRLLEQANRIHYQQQEQIQQLTATVNQQKNMFKILQYALIGSLLLIGLFLFMRISRQIHDMAEDLETQKDNAMAATQSKSIFLANMSHEIRTPLNAITGFINLLKDQEDDTTKLKYLKTIDNSSQSLLGIINDILDFSKIESNKLEFDYHDFDPHESFLSVADLFKAKCSEKNLLLNVDFDSNMPHSLHSDPLRIKQVISNLLSNAVKFTEAGKSVRLEIHYNHTHEELYVAVIDQGIGIPADKQVKIFDAFSQAESNTTRQFGGTGLGLAISSLLIELLGGTLELESEVGVGSKFFFTLPIKKGQPIKATVQKIEAKSTQENKKILLVEDNKTNQMLMGAILKKMNIDFDLAEDGLEAVEAYQKESYKLILMDENMPNMSGSEATRKIRELETQSGEHIIIISLTANAMKGDRERFIEAGMDDYLTKPLKIPELNRIMQEYLD